MCEHLEANTRAVEGQVFKDKQEEERDGGGKKERVRRSHDESQPNDRLRHSADITVVTIVTDVPCNRYISPGPTRPLLIFNPHHLPIL